MFFKTWVGIWICIFTGNKVSFSFTQFNLEESEFCNDDYVEIREGSSSGQLQGVFCGSELPSNITISSSLWIKFRSDTTGSGPGFSAYYTLCKIYLNLSLNLFKTWIYIWNFNVCTYLNFLHQYSCFRNCQPTKRKLTKQVFSLW